MSYSPKQVAQKLGVSESSVKRWLDQGAVPILRTAGGHRRISQQSVDELLERFQRKANRSGLEAVLEPEASVPEEASAAQEPWSDKSVEEIRDTFCLTLSQGREGGCRCALEELLRRGYSAAAAVDCLITPAMHTFGHDWEQGDLAIYQERRACGIALDLIHALKQRIPVQRNGPVAIGGTPEGDNYQLPTAMIELALHELGWQATSLGCNLPMSEFCTAVREYQPKVVWISISWLEDEERLVREFNRMADTLPQQTVLLLGGRAATDSLRPRLRYTAHGDTLSHLIELAGSLTAKR